jgi:hypothetical protein
MAKKCGTCVYFKERESSVGELGQCRIVHPPVVYNHHLEVVESEFPVVDKDEWCGEYEVSDGNKAKKPS